MHFISHRGNICGPNKGLENTESYIIEAIKLGYECEIDIWVIDNLIYLGHDKPDNLTSRSFLDQYKCYLWIHCKNPQALEYFTNTSYNYFFHDHDMYTITSNGFIWGNINSEVLQKMILVMPEKYTITISKAKKCVGICSDYIEHYKKVTTMP